jgi:sugar (pentulose or hexulose) kinase
MGIYPNMDEVDQLVEISHEVLPDDANWNRYDALYHEYRQLYQALTPIHKRLYQIP